MFRRILGSLCVLVTLVLPLHAQSPSLLKAAALDAWLDTKRLTA